MVDPNIFTTHKGLIYGQLVDLQVDDALKYHVCIVDEVDHILECFLHVHYIKLYYFINLE
jgi:hypothetical protein